MNNTLRTALLGAILMSSGAVAWPGAACAQTAAVQSYQIPVGNLDDALQQWATQSGQQLMYSGDLVQGKRSAGLSGSYAPAEALRRLLEGSGLESERLNARTLVLKKVEAAPTPVQPREQQSSTRPPEEKEVYSLPSIMVRGERTLNMDIRRTEDDPQPYVVFDRETIQRSGAQNLEAFLRDRLPMNASGLANGLRVSQASTRSRFNLRGLGGGQTLILIDGRRTTPGPSIGGSPEQPEINGIPMSAIERIEVLPTTASGIYGGSATGGVINIILRQDYAGVEAKAIYGNALDTDVADRRFDLSGGFNLGERTNLLLSASYSDQNTLRLRDRPELVERYYDTVRANAPQLLLPPNNPPLGSVSNIRSADGSNLVLRDGTPLNSPITHVPTGYAGAASDGGAALAANAGQYDLGLADTSQAITGGGTQLGQAPRNTALRATLRHEFSPRVSAFLEANATETNTLGTMPSPVGSFTQPFRVSALAPNNPFTSDILVTAPVAGLENASFDTNTTQHRATGGLVVALPADWQTAFDYTWGRMRVRQGGIAHSATAASTAAVLNGVVDVVRDTRAYPIDLMPYLATDPLEGTYRITFQNMGLRFAGPVLELPGGQVTVSTLFEHREEKFADAMSRSPGLALIYPARSSTASSVYVETKVPVFSEKNRRPGLEALDLQLAARTDRYRTHGATGFVVAGSSEPIVTASNETRSTNPTVALRYQPIQDLVLRTSYGTGFVAPGVSQLAPSIYPGPFTVIDPLRGGTPTTLAVGQIVYLGNPDLGPEKSKNWSAGLILTPRFVPGLRLSLDYTRIRKTDNIASYPGGQQSIVDDEALLPGRVTRGPNLPGDPAGWAGPITQLDATLFNVAGAEVEAFDLQLDYSLETDVGTFSLATVATRQNHYTTTAIPGQPPLENVGVSYANPQRLTGNVELRWQHQAWTVGWLARYYDDYFTANPAAASSAAALALQGNGGRVPSQTYHDLYVSWVPDLSGRSVPGFLFGTEFQIGIRNVFDKLPPFDASVYNTFRTFHSPLGDPLGTSYQVAVTKRF